MIVFSFLNDWMLIEFSFVNSTIFGSLHSSRAILAELKNQEIVFESFDMKDLNSQYVVLSRFSERKFFIHSQFTQKSFKRFLTVHKCLCFLSPSFNAIRRIYNMFIAPVCQNGSEFCAVF